MRALRVPAVAGLLLVAALAVPARATGAPFGRQTCEGRSLPEPLATGADQTWEVDAGPVVLADLAAPATPVYGRIRCTIRSGDVHTAPAYVEVASDPMPVVVALHPVFVTFAASAEQDAFLCTEVDLADGTAYYWDDDARVWSTDPDVLCDFRAGRPPI